MSSYVASTTPVEGAIELTAEQIATLGLKIYLVLGVPTTVPQKGGNKNNVTNKPTNRKESGSSNQTKSDKPNHSNTTNNSDETPPPPPVKKEKTAPVKKEKKVKERSQRYCFYGMLCPSRLNNCKHLHDESHPATHCCVKSCDGNCGLKHKPKKAKPAKKQGVTNATTTEEQSDDSDDESDDEEEGVTTNSSA